MCQFRMFSASNCASASTLVTSIWQIGPCYGHYNDDGSVDSNTFTEEGVTFYDSTFDCTGNSRKYVPSTQCIVNDDEVTSPSAYEEFSTYGVNGAARSVLGSVSLLVAVIVGVSAVLF